LYYASETSSKKTPLKLPEVEVVFPDQMYEDATNVTNLTLESLESSQEDVTSTLQVLMPLINCSEDAICGDAIPNAFVTGQDGSGNNLQATTDDNGYATIVGDPGTWFLSVSANGFEPYSWSQQVTRVESELTVPIYLLKNGRTTG
jgi:hypothetical protein